MGLGSLDYTMLMNDSKTVCAENVAELYLKLSKEYRYMVNMKDENRDNLRYVANKIRAEFSKLGYADYIITDMLVEFLFKNNKRYKQLLWFCYGENILDNLKMNLAAEITENSKTIQCIDCGEWFEVDISNKRSCRCEYCQKLLRRKTRTKQQREYREK